MKKLALNIGLSLLALLGASSCNIKEDTSDCPGSMILDYSAYPDVILDDIAADEQVKVFIFDPNGICCDIRSFTYGELSDIGFEFELPITYRGYNAVVWHGLNGEDYDSSSMDIGESYDDFYMELEYNSSNACYSCIPDPLWASDLEPIDYCAKITRHRVYMTRLHTEIYVNVQQLTSDGSLLDIEAGEFHPVINACNNVYHTDYEISEESIMLEYTNDDEEEDEVMVIHDSHICSCVGTLRITTDMNCSLEVEDNDGNNILIGDSDQLDLVEYMLATKTDSSISDQEFLDLNKVWDISIIVKEQTDSGNIAIGIVINGWVKWFSSSELS